MGCLVVLEGVKVQNRPSDYADYNNMSILLTTQPHLEADPKARLHYLAHTLIAQQPPSRTEHKRPQHLKDLHQYNLVARWIGANKTGMGDGFRESLYGRCW